MKSTSYGKPGGVVIDAQEKANELYPPDHEVDDPNGATGVARSDPYGYDEIANRAFVQGARFEREQTLELLNRLKGVEENYTPITPEQAAASGYALGELQGIIAVLEARNAPA